MIDITKPTATRNGKRVTELRNIKVGKNHRIQGYIVLDEKPPNLRFAFWTRDGKLAGANDTRRFDLIQQNVSGA